MLRREKGGGTDRRTPRHALHAIRKYIVPSPRERLPTKFSSEFTMDGNRDIPGQTHQKNRRLKVAGCNGAGCIFRFSFSCVSSP